MHSANSLPSVTLGKRHSAKPPTAKGSLPSVGFRALGKVPAQGGATWPLCRVLDPGTRQTFETLPSARVLALGKVPVLSCGRPLCRVYWLKHSAKWHIFLFFAYFFSVFRYKYNKYIYINAGVITGSYNDKYIIFNCDNSIDTNNTR